MATRDLGKFERVGVRNVWPHEALNFTPWLARNLDVLSEAVGLQLELVDTEATLPGEGGRVDILAKEVDTGTGVVIENQLETSDNDHGAGILGYAAHSNSDILIWVASGFTDWHRRTVKWLNRNGVRIYAVEVSAWRIGDAYAPYLKLIAGPNDFDYTSVSGRRSNGQKYRDFFQPLIDRLREEGITDRVAALAANDHAFPSGYDGITYAVGFWSGPSASAYLWIATEDREYNKQVFDALHGLRNEIEGEINGTLTWDRRDKQRMCSVFLSRNGAIGDPPEALDKIREWMFVNLVDLKNAIQPYLKQVINELKVGAPEPAP